MKQKLILFWNAYPAFLKNKYVLAIIVFFTYLMFFDSNDIPSQVRFSQNLKKLNKQTKYFEKEIEKSKKEYAATFSTIEQMEAYAREEYLMKKPDEDLFIIEVK